NIIECGGSLLKTYLFRHLLLAGSALDEHPGGFLAGVVAGADDVPLVRRAPLAVACGVADGADRLSAVAHQPRIGVDAGFVAQIVRVHGAVHCRNSANPSQVFRAHRRLSSPRASAYDRFVMPVRFGSFDVTSRWFTVRVSRRVLVGSHLLGL